MIFSSFNLFLFFYVMLFVRDMMLVTISLFNIINKNHVPQANLAGKLFIFFSSIMIILFIYEINTTFAYVFYVLSMIMMISSTITYLSELKKVRSLWVSLIKYFLVLPILEKISQILLIIY